MVCKSDLIEDKMDNYPEFIINMLKVDFCGGLVGVIEQ